LNMVSCLEANTYGSILTGAAVINELPGFLQETAFLDRLRGIIPGWKVRKLGGSSFATSVGLKADFFGDALLALRDDLYADQYCARRISLLGTDRTGATKRPFAPSRAV
jgi:predicted ATP-dependent Lon-type protease